MNLSHLADVSKVQENDGENLGLFSLFMTELFTGGLVARIIIYFNFLHIFTSC